MILAVEEALSRNALFIRIKMRVNNAVPEALGRMGQEHPAAIHPTYGRQQALV